jgi:hypothetical protein
MSERANRLRSHQRNIDRYQGLLKSSLSDIELRFVEQRLSEERFALAMVQFMSQAIRRKKMITRVRWNSAKKTKLSPCFASASWTPRLL